MEQRDLGHEVNDQPQESRGKVDCKGATWEDHGHWVLQEYPDVPQSIRPYRFGKEVWEGVMSVILKEF